MRLLKHTTGAILHGKTALVPRIHGSGTTRANAYVRAKRGKLHYVIIAYLSPETQLLLCRCCFDTPVEFRQDEELKVYSRWTKDDK